MNKEQLQKLVDAEPNGLYWIGQCHDCHCDIEILIDPQDDGIYISGGAVYKLDNNMTLGKCDKCYLANSQLTNYQECEVYSRVVGYLRPVKQWNPGKQAEHNDRANFKMVK